MILLLILHLFAPSAIAYSEILQARQTEDLLLGDYQLSNRLRFEELCRSELDLQQFPESCLKRLAEPGSSDLLDLPEPWLRQVIESCQARVADIRDLQRLDALLRGPIPPLCARALQEHRDDLLYIRSAGMHLEIKPTP